MFLYASPLSCGASWRLVDTLLRRCTNLRQSDAKAAAGAGVGSTADAVDASAEGCDLGKKSHWDTEFANTLAAFQESGDPGYCWFEEQLGRRLLDLFDDSPTLSGLKVGDAVACRGCRMCYQAGAVTSCLLPRVADVARRGCAMTINPGSVTECLAGWAAACAGALASSS